MADAEGLLLLRAGGAAADGHGRVQHSTADINDNGKRQREDPSDEYEKVRQLQVSARAAAPLLGVQRTRDGVDGACCQCHTGEAP